MEGSSPEIGKKKWIQQKLIEKVDSISEPINVNILLGTYNVNNKLPEIELSPWLFQCQTTLPHIIIVGLQEMDIMSESYSLTTTISYTDTKEYKWKVALQQAIETNGLDFELIISKKLIGMCIFLFTKKDLKPHIKQVASCSVASGLMGYVGNKGAVAIRFRLYNHKYIVISSHLAAHAEYYFRRNYDYSEISRRLSFPPYTNGNTSLIDEIFEDNSFPASILECDFCFWMGDLNYRIEMDSSEARHLIDTKDYDSLMNLDQLIKAIRNKEAFIGYEEGPLLFPPTFKYDVGTNIFDTSEKFRTPSWTDRILWKSNPKIQLIAYWCGMELTGSDHKPVAAMFVMKSSLVVASMLNEAYREVLKEIDTFENASIPLTLVDRNCINVGETYFGIEKDYEIIIKNLSTNSAANFKFIPKGPDLIIYKPWINIYPLKGTLLPSTINF